MKVIQTYKCDGCDQMYFSKEACLRCESKHTEPHHLNIVRVSYKRPNILGINYPRDILVSSPDRPWADAIYTYHSVINHDRWDEYVDGLP